MAMTTPTSHPDPSLAFSAGLDFVPGSSRRILTFAGGKGGVGRSFLAANLGIALARKFQSVLLVDGNLGSPDLHTALGREIADVSLADFFENNVPIEELIRPTFLPTLKIVCGAQVALESANLKYLKKLQFLANLKRLVFDFILVDLGSGNAFNTLDFFLVGDSPLAITAPDPSAIENGWRFLKSAFFRHLLQPIDNETVRILLKKQMNARELGSRNPLAFLDEVRREDPASERQIRARLNDFRPRLILNRIRETAEESIGPDMAWIARRHLGFDLEYAGSLPYDDTARLSLRQGRPFLDDPAPSALRSAIEGLAQRLLGEGQLTLGLVSS